mmetsp:Transcript_105388/g.302980  ORF Transcript_105388/g.302980 Transcript_105388/m.302980 type:complete len:258 (-) Transcript_105388:589-1362(-)
MASPCNSGSNSRATRRTAPRVRRPSGALAWCPLLRGRLRAWRASASGRGPRGACAACRLVIGRAILSVWLPGRPVPAPAVVQSRRRRPQATSVSRHRRRRPRRCCMFFRHPLYRCGIRSGVNSVPVCCRRHQVRSCHRRHRLRHRAGHRAPSARGHHCLRRRPARHRSRRCSVAHSNVGLCVQTSLWVLRWPHWDCPVCRTSRWTCRWDPRCRPSATATPASSWMPSTASSPPPRPLHPRPKGRRRRGLRKSGQGLH